MKRGFTIIELLVASLLLGMLVSVLTMLFNASSLAWRTGTAGVAKLHDARTNLGILHEIRDEVLPGVGESGASVDTRALKYRTVSVWAVSGQNKLRAKTERAYDDINWQNVSQLSSGEAKNGASRSVTGGSMVGGKLFTVGVRSWGPDRKMGTDDDITTWPEDVN